MGRAINPYVSVDCVLLGFDGDKLKVLLVRQRDRGIDNVTEYYKLPGSLIYMDEDLDDAAKRVLKELTGLVQVDMTQFKAFGSANRLSNPKDTVWLERFHRLDHHRQRNTLPVPPHPLKFWLHLICVMGRKWAKA